MERSSPDLGCVRRDGVFISTQWIRDGYVRGDMQWRQDSYGCSLDVSEMTSGVYGNSVAEPTWDECMFLKGWRKLRSGM